ncbi:helix-turn-helix transcriptional regulator [Mesorhizobium sp. M0152]|uniref:AraC family transcriptional regulator n=1 Tax=Mesorhizobium sp. M0152 TaxID=2956898 RepID=UPI0033387145
MVCGEEPGGHCSRRDLATVDLLFGGRRHSCRDVRSGEHHPGRAGDLLRIRGAAAGRHHHARDFLSNQARAVQADGRADPARHARHADTRTGGVAGERGAPCRVHHRQGATRGRHHRRTLRCRLLPRRCRSSRRQAGDDLVVAEDRRTSPLSEGALGRLPRPRPGGAHLHVRRGLFRPRTWPGPAQGSWLCRGRTPRAQAAGAAAVAAGANTLRVSLPDLPSREPFRDRVEALAKKQLRRLDLALLGRELGLAPRTLARRFSDELHTTPGRWIQDQRIDAAKSLLESTRLGIVEVCYQVGYQDAASFSRLFMRAVGLSPGEYRRQNQ